MNVWDETQKRIKYIFDEFDNVYVSFSGGKDSGVLLNLCIDYIRSYAPSRKIGVFHMDYEAQYQMTTDYVNEVFNKDLDIIEPYHICLPLSAQCCTSMSQDHWVPWDKNHKDIWVRDMPKNCINENNNPMDFWYTEMWDYHLQEEFGPWYHKIKNAKKTCCLVGIRTQESLNRWRAIYSDKNINKYKQIEYTRKIVDNVYNAYPIFDWSVEDIWIANYRNKWTYNHLYDLFYQAGVPYGKMRVASPFNDCASESLKLYKVIDPKNWGKMIGRVNGVNFTGIYGGTTAMGWKSIKLPPGHTWKSYMEFLLSTLPVKSAENYKKKLETSIEFWKNKGGCLDDDTINQLKDRNINLTIMDSTNYKTHKRPVRMDYLDDIDIDDFRAIPTYKRMCICILKNDHLCKFMGFSLTKSEWALRENAEVKYTNIKEKINGKQ